MNIRPLIINIMPLMQSFTSLRQKIIIEMHTLLIHKTSSTSDSMIYFRSNVNFIGVHYFTTLSDLLRHIYSSLLYRTPVLLQDMTFLLVIFSYFITKKNEFMFYNRKVHYHAFDKYIIASTNASNMMNSSCMLNIVIVTLKYKSIHWAIQLTIKFSNIYFFSSGNIDGGKYNSTVNIKYTQWNKAKPHKQRRPLNGNKKHILLHA